MPFDAADLAAFVDADMPGYVLASIGAANVAGLFSNGYGASFDIAGSTPRLTCASADVSAVTTSTSITINGVGYTVAGIEPNGNGMTVLRLAES